jgi:hypothetical protein
VGHLHWWYYYVHTGPKFIFFFVYYIIVVVKYMNEYINQMGFFLVFFPLNAEIYPSPSLEICREKCCFPTFPWYLCWGAICVATFSLTHPWSSASSVKKLQMELLVLFFGVYVVQFIDFHSNHNECKFSLFFPI